MKVYRVNEKYALSISMSNKSYMKDEVSQPSVRIDGEPWFPKLINFPLTSDEWHPLLH